ncbi:sensor histidine kinase [Chitiniphilus eburneus]|uniref:histidine kinase n=1 Tax=Chitiniphilus eburneus TaxID=2571148 RepID=A0A4U0QDY9_9NEIS|nr:HAMP domain-containing sensor histidine kinase [Chitiniphilus eburneus]TJZ74084.1 HAMP domain-containing histidine kinase [Chitiniphilus eburneus]
MKSGSSKVFGRVADNVRYLGPRFFIFGLVAVIGFPLYYVVWHYLYPQPYENLPLRLVGSLLFIPVMLARWWPRPLKRYLPIYWWIATLLALPFFFVYMLLMNGGEPAWAMSALAAVFVMILAHDWLTLAIHACLGTLLAVALFMLTGHGIAFDPLNAQYIPILLFALVLGGAANYSDEMIKQERSRAMLSIASSIAHELRTPLLGIKTGAAGAAQHLPTLVDGYVQAVRHGLPVPALRASHLDSLRNVLGRIEAEVDYSSTMIDILLMNARPQGVSPVRLYPCSMERCLEVALTRYPFTQEERGVVRTRVEQDFTFRGTELLMVHVLFNLLKNALHHIAKAGKGGIALKVTQLADGTGQFSIEDGGVGVAPEVLPHIFDAYYSRGGADDQDADVRGAGMGLAFCRGVIRSFNGRIECESRLGDYTRFTITLPVAVPK